MKKYISVVFILLFFALFFYSSVSYPFTVYAEEKELIDETTGIKVSGNFSVDAELNTAIITDGVKYRQAERALDGIAEDFLLYGVGLATPTTGLETFTIFLPISSDIDPEDCEIYRITNTTATKLVASRASDFISFSGNDFGTFAITFTKTSANVSAQKLTSFQIALISVGSVLCAVLIGFGIFELIKHKKSKI